ncbi:VWA domain-containing protein [Bacillus atrophaeus]|uniref:VWA domain-containing protein n=1 Tax=Bacillus atrophaeus TaxID=1452 RepID=UPI002DBF186F|nr:VWA domain-containing protein [Bacillus atrophaeus]MEC1900992.1 VWA domain-containing protein [Bacillus atrophaeus]MEC2396157.1 VWA domain-containing protein [Bacillus atrophaeus]MED4437329.1 VWA domain-containing protein [Bacillus atrophaeus]MED4567073.1 VWA domain-containing protein [Bacillus atrophaeus]MED4573395.1 VWA domain-containing protein [Bacillus atrophaeus]
MDKLQEIKNRFSIATLLYKKQIDVNWSTILEDQEFLIESVEKQQEINAEHKRQQEVTVNQFRQAREEIQRLNQENGRFKKALQIYAAENNYRRTLRMSKWATVEMENRFGDFNPSFMEVDRGQTARKALEGAAE